jgi:hypothetical protein
LAGASDCDERWHCGREFQENDRVLFVVALLNADAHPDPRQSADVKSGNGIRLGEFLAIE